MLQMYKIYAAPVYEFFLFHSFLLEVSYCKILTRFCDSK